MIDYDYGPACFAVVVAIGFLAPFFYSFFVDNYDKKNPQIRSNKS
ncbi:hypothetical protein [Candidatus Nitrotoga sp. HW29]|nr:hypothetical protein [Candidatus Nitrotoga sp. HW29]